MAGLLSSDHGQFPFQNVYSLTDERATRRAVLEAIEAVFSNVEANDAVFAYLAGHGAVAGGEYYFVAHDTRDQAIPTSGVPLGRIKAAFDSSPSRRAFLWLDFCHSGGVIPRELGGVPDDPQVLRKTLEVVQGQGKLIIVACTQSQAAWESATAGHGLFTDALLRGLKGAAEHHGEVTVNSLFDYIDRQMGSDRQRPMMFGQMTGRIVLMHESSAKIKTVQSSTSTDRFGSADPALGLLQGDKTEPWQPVSRDGSFQVHVPNHKPRNLPYPPLGPLFKGRDTFLTDLHDRLAKPAGSGSGSGRPRATVSAHVLHGLGGVGKTRAAIEYAWRFAEGYGALLFVSARSSAELRARLADLADVLEIETLETAVEPRLHKVLDWLDAHPGWLLILDNVDTKEAAAEAQGLLAQLTAGHVLITSRIANWRAGIDCLDLHVLAEVDGVAFLLERTSHRRYSPGDEATAAVIARELDGLALALEQAGAYIDKGHHSFAEYLRLWKLKRPEVLAWHDEGLTGYPVSVAVTWETTFAQLKEPEGVLLRVLSWLAPEPIPLLLLETEPVAGALPDARDALTGLSNYSLVRFALEGDLVEVHRLVQEITRRRSTEAECAAALETALAAVAVTALAPGDPSDVRNWGVWRPLAPHVEAVVWHTDGTRVAKPTSSLMNNLGLYLQARGQFSAAEPLYRRALAIDERSYGPDHPDVATDLNNLALLLQFTNRASEAEPLYRRALAVRERSFGPDHPDVATALNNLAGLLQATNRVVEAEPLYRRALAIDERSYGPDHPDVATNLNNLALLLKATTRLVEAEPLYRRALAIDERSYGPDHPRVAIRLNNLAVLLQATNRVAEAEPLYRRALAIDERSYGSDHPEVAIDLSNLARLLYATNRAAEAKPLYQRAFKTLRRFREITGHEHPHWGKALSYYQGLLKAMGLTDDEIGRRVAEVTVS